MSLIGNISTVEINCSKLSIKDNEARNAIQEINEIKKDIKDYILEQLNIK